MVLRYRTVGQTTHSVLSDVAAAARQFSGRPEGLPISPARSTTAEPLLLAYWPAARPNNFQSLLYCRSWEYGVATLPVASFDELAEVPWAGPMACHFHWLATIDDDEKIARFESVLQTLRAQQRKIVWTVHNVLPHDGTDNASAVKVRLAITEAADLVHVMNERTADLVEPFFSLAGKRIFHSPHPSYIGGVPDTALRAEARFQLGLAPETTVFLCFGAIQPYKGIEELIAAARMLADRRPALDWALVIAGVGKDEALVQRLLQSDDIGGRLSIHPRAIAVEDVQYFFRAADYAVCAYRSSLNSGVAMLALTFGVPLVAPVSGSFDRYLECGAGLGYQSETAGALAMTLARAIEANPGDMSLAAREIAVDQHPALASREFFERLLGGLYSDEDLVVPG